MEEEESAPAEVEEKPEPVPPPPPTPPPPPPQSPPQHTYVLSPLDEDETEDVPGCGAFLCGYHTLLELAASSGDPSRVAGLLAQGPRSWEDSWLGPFGMLGTFSPVASAAAVGSADSVEVLLQAGADPQRGTRLCGGTLMSASPLWRAVHAEEQSTQVTRALLKRGADPNDGLSWGLFGHWGSATPLSAAAAARDAPAVKELLKAGARPNAGLTIGPFGLFGKRTPLECAIGAALQQQQQGVAASGSDSSAAEVARLLLDAGAEPNVGDHNLGLLGPLLLLAPRQRVLFTAAATGDAEAVDALLRCGADPDAGSGWGPFGLLSHTTPLAVAAEKGHEAAAKALIKGGARLHAGTRVGLPVAPVMTGTPLAEAARQGHAGVVAALLDNGARPAKGYDVCGGLLGHATPLSWALHGRHTDAAEALLAAHLEAAPGKAEDNDDDGQSDVFETGPSLV